MRAVRAAGRKLISKGQPKASVLDEKHELLLKPKRDESKQALEESTCIYLHHELWRKSRSVIVKKRKG